jgi:GDPmannose 4,6-dehydratase
MKRALITGVTGQDGAYLSDLLVKKGYRVFGAYRRSSTPNFWRLQALGVLDKISLIPTDMGDMASMLEAVQVSDPDEIYNLAAQSYVGASFDQPLLTTEIDGLGPLRFLEIIRNTRKNIKFYQASTSELYGDSIDIKENCQCETTRFSPSSPYAAAKMLGFNSTKIYREAYGIFSCNGILFNHESPLRGLEFVTRKITNAVARIKLGYQKSLSLGNLDAIRDWGFAPDYVVAMWKMLQTTKADDYVVATNESHAVREFVQEAFKVAGLDWKKYVQVDSRLVRPKDVPILRGDYSKAKKELSWEPKVKFKELVRKMLDADLSRWKRFSKGERFPWDAFNYPEGIEIMTRSRNVVL